MQLSTELLSRGCMVPEGAPTFSDCALPSLTVNQSQPVLPQREPAQAPAALAGARHRSVAGERQRQGALIGESMTRAWRRRGRRRVLSRVALGCAAHSVARWEAVCCGGALYLVWRVIAVDVIQPGRLLADDDGHRRQPRRPEQEQRNDDRQQLRAGARPVRRKAAVNASAAEQRRFVEEPALPTRPRAEEPVMHPPQRTPPVVNTGPCTTLASRPPAGLRASASRRTTSQDPGRRRRFSKVPRPPARSQAPALCL